MLLDQYVAMIQAGGIPVVCTLQPADAPAVYRSSAAFEA
jgi:hypothetical protein